METNAFDKFVAKQREELAKEPNWREVRDEWLAALKSLHIDIIDYLNSMQDRVSRSLPVWKQILESISILVAARD